jgi:hypothetical protein
MAQTLQQRHESILSAVPAEGLFEGKDWRVTPEPLALTHAQIEELEKLGYRLLLFQRACNELYHRSASGKAPAWVADYLDRGKPQRLIEQGRRAGTRAALPAVIRPDLILTDDGFVIAELDTVPGGIGLAAWLNQTYSRFGTHDILGGGEAMITGFQNVVPDGRVLISEESATYRPEMNWIALQTAGRLRVEAAEDISAPCPHYRFYELFDLPNLPADILLASDPVSPPVKAFLEEKLWFALFWAHPLREFWRRELSERHWLALQRVIPRTWVMDPSPVPHYAVIPGLEIQSWEELGGFSQKQRDLVLKISGFSPIGWGSRSVVIGSDVAQEEWRQAVNRALEDFPANPWILQQFHRARVVEHPWFDDAGRVQTMRGRVRLCPYYFVIDGRAHLSGALATIAPADKKILHGMRDAIMAPAARVV